MKALLAIVLLAGCEKNLLADLHDAGSGGSGDDAAPIDAIPLAGCPTPAMPLSAGNHKLYLNAEGVTLTSDGTCDDALSNCTSLLETSPTTFDAFGDPTFITQVAATVQQVLAPYSLDVVTTRPTSGEYQMVVIGGSPQQIGASPAAYSAYRFTCGMLEPHTIGLVFQDEPFSVDNYANVVLNDFALMAGLGETTLANDCMCGLDADACEFSTTTVCTYGSAAPTTKVVFEGVPLDCGFTPTEDEPALLKAALGCR